MARLAEVPKVLRKVGVIPFVKKVWFEINDDNLVTWAASLAYSWLFAIFPFLVFLLTLIPLLKDDWKQEAVRRINIAIDVSLPLETQRVLHSYLDPRLDELLHKPPASIKGILSLGLIITIWAASGGLNNTMAAMNKCYDVENPRAFYIQRPLAILLTLVVATLILAVIVLIPLGTLITQWLTSGAKSAWAIVQPGSSVATTVPSAAHVIFHPVWLALWQLFRYSFGVLLMFCVVAIIYHFGPRIKQKRRVVTPGSVFTVTIWIALGLIFRLYVDRYATQSYGKTYGAVGGVAILLLLFYLDALVLLIGAEINAEVDFAMKNLAPAPQVPSVTQSETSSPLPAK
jgi:membrane protein